MDEPQGTPIAPESNEGEDPSVPENAILIVEGTKAVGLTQDIVKIGRSHDNTVVIDDQIGRASCRERV